MYNMNHKKFGQIAGGIIILIIISLITLLITTCVRRKSENKPTPHVPAKKEDAQKPEKFKLRKKPKKFKPNTYLPRKKESQASGAIDLTTFSPGKSLIYFDDKRVWWESDHDKNDIEDDHTIYVTMEAPLRRLIDLVDKENATLKVQDTYRPAGIHNKKSLHKEGRAIDLTCEGISLEELAKLCWMAGFDWVYYELNGGAHIHCSVKREDEKRRNRRLLAK